MTYLITSKVHHQIIDVIAVASAVARGRRAEGAQGSAHLLLLCRSLELRQRVLDLGQRLGVEVRALLLAVCCEGAIAVVLVWKGEKKFYFCRGQRDVHK